MLQVGLAETSEECLQALEFLHAQHSHPHLYGLDHLLELQETNQLDQTKFLMARLQRTSGVCGELVGVLVLSCLADRTATISPPVFVEGLDSASRSGSAEPSVDQQVVEGEASPARIHWTNESFDKQTGLGISAQQVGDLLVQQALLIAQQQGVQLVQGVLDQADHFNHDLFCRHGLPLISRLLIMLRPGGALPERDGEKTDLKKFAFELLPVEDQFKSDRLARLIERTYEGSDDFPELIGKKTGEQAVMTHCLQGKFQPRFWYFIRVAGEDAGVLFLAWHDDWEQWELTYLGLVPEFRGQGVARYSIEQVLSNEEIDGAPIFLGVDSRNLSAVRLYKSLGFAATASQQVHFVWL